MPRVSDEQRLAAAEKRYIELKAASIAKEQIKAAKEKERQRKKRARVLIELGAALVEQLRTTPREQQELMLRLLEKAKQSPDPKRRPEALAWLRNELGLPEPSAPAQEFQVPAGATPPKRG